MSKLLAALAATVVLAVMGMGCLGITYDQCGENKPCKKPGWVCGADHLCWPPSAINTLTGEDGGAMSADGGAVVDAGIVPASDGGQIADGGVIPASDGGQVTEDGGVVAADGGVMPAEDGGPNPDGGVMHEDGGPVTGAEGGHCYGNGTCNTGLSCLSNFCVNAPVQPGPGTERGVCYGNGTCNEGLTCMSDVCVRVPADDGGPIDDGGAFADGGASINEDGGAVSDGGVFEDGGAVAEDGGVFTDGGTPAEDGGAVAEDGGALPEDGGALAEDGGAQPDGGPIADGGTTPEDGGAIAEDGGAIADGGVVAEDGGTPADGGVSAEDGGAVAEDGGPTEDGGALPEDGGAFTDGGASVTEDGGVAAEDGGAVADGGAFTDGGPTIAEDGGAFTDGGTLPEDGGPTDDGGASINEDGGATEDGGPSVTEDGGVSLDGGTLSDGGTLLDGGITCADGLSLCEDTCTDLHKDLLNCGICGRVCADTDDCVNGACVPAPCGRGVRDGDVVVEVTFPFGKQGSKVAIRDGNAPGMSYCIFDYVPGATRTCIMPGSVQYVQVAFGDCATGTSCAQLAVENDWSCNCYNQISDGGLVSDGGLDGGVSVDEDGGLSVDGGVLDGGLSDGGMSCWIDGPLVVMRCVSNTLVSEDWTAQLTPTGANCKPTVAPDGGLSVDGGVSVTEDGGVTLDGGILACPDGMVDEGGVCVCPNHLSICDGVCTDLQNDFNNCGSCGHACPSSLYACEASNCVQNQCEAGVYVGQRVFEITNPAGMLGTYVVIRASDGSHSCIDPYVAGSVTQCVMPTTVDVVQVASGNCSSGTVSCVQLAIELSWVCNCWDSANPDGGYTPIDGGNLACRTDAVLQSHDCLPGGTYSPWQLWTSAWTPLYNGANCVPATSP